MADPGYDFFATGRGAGAPPPALPPVPGARPAAAALNRFGSPAAVSTNQFGGPAAPAGPGGSPGAVNQIGLPVDVLAAPSGPYPGPGVAAAPQRGPGTAGTWSGPAPAGRPAPGAHAARTAGSRRPDSVLTAAVVGLVVSGLVLLMGAVVLFLYLYLAVKGQLDAAGVAPSVGLDELVSAVTAALLQLVGICLAFALLYALAGVAVLRCRAWGAWTLLVLGSLTLLKAAYDLVTSGLPSVSTGYLAGWVVSNGLAAVLVVMLLQPSALRWMRGQ